MIAMWPDVVNATDARGATALHQAALHSNAPAAQLLLAKGASAALADVAGRTPGMVARAALAAPSLAALLPLREGGAFAEGVVNDECDLTTVDADNITAVDFELRFRTAQMPVLVRGAFPAECVGAASPAPVLAVACIPMTASRERLHRASDRSHSISLPRLLEIHAHALSFFVVSPTPTGLSLSSPSGIPPALPRCRSFACRYWPAATHWASRARLGARYGALEVETGSIPYAAEFGVAQRATRTLAEYAAGEWTPSEAVNGEGGDGGNLSYLFSLFDPESAPTLWADIVAGLPHWLKIWVEEEAGDQRRAQIYLGPAGTVR